MSMYRGIDKVDASALQAQRALIEALWSTLENKIDVGAPARIEAFFFSHGEASAQALVAGFGPESGWESQVDRVEDEPERQRIRLVSPPVHLTHEAMLELVDVMMIAGADHACTFDGFQVAVGEGRRRPWWRFWSR